ncbi:unnamed protein product [marine sediment metagenome]|uniref:Uncharacterized protein n=1 Tax=marine sediment metagenome TaxID=412755 RepID=X1R241_9ZZZZ
MRLTKFDETYIRANTKYFFGQKFITKEQCDSVMSWLKGKDDKEARILVVSWMRADAVWVEEMLPVAMRRFWYVAPLVFVGLKLIKRTLLKRVKELTSSSFKGVD